ncbi:MAG: 16S rRNA (adenine(1518)-N(6)/adenine(1519)-N(6))-dimethyltransferase [Candidatus Nomurabacteria bacterium]|jgi:16S rRNA (adenine1518-N6/adenine1519-N6)-dimethyltransferase|nr:16S rRNA (adenine(1518)-N(6)/adenine(1519)-N(6))-dimethyltransferase [Candidatus Nomurabacteria bacterium]
MSGGRVKAKKSLGQNWLRDEGTLGYIADCAELTGEDFVLEIGAGLGTLTRVLMGRAGRVLAVEYDRELAGRLASEFPVELSTMKMTTAKWGSSPTSFFRRDLISPELTSGSPAKSNHEIAPKKACREFAELCVVWADFLQFNLDELPQSYKVVGNIPYYITSKILRKLLTARNRPQLIVLLVQREVAERLAAGAGDYSVLGISAQVYAEVTLGAVVRAEMFEPAPKVDSQVVIMKPYGQIFGGTSPKVFSERDFEKKFFRVVKAGFSARRKKLRTALAGGLNISVADAEKLLHAAGIDPNLRAQDLTIDDWRNLSGAI